MKNSKIAVPLLIVGIVALVGFLIFQFSKVAVTEEFPAPKPTGKTPDYIKAKMDPAQRAEIEKMEREAGLDKAPPPGAAQQPKANPYGQR